jgi:Recombination endonuclease VII
MREPSKASYRNRRAAQGKAVRQPRELPAGFRVCPDCNTIKMLQDFPSNKKSTSGVGTYCKPCHNARSMETRQRLYGGGRHFHLKRRYGMGAEDVAALIEAQGGRCAICLAAPAVHVDHDHDHDHVTGRVRGVLCFNCNGGLGQFRDRTDVMRKAIDYLEGTA